jgi:hypothetical protein
MGQDVHQVELQNKDMQVASANQKLLLKELQNFIGLLSLPAYVVKVLREESLDTVDGVNECALAFGQIIRLLNKDFQEMSDMAAVKEQKAYYQNIAQQFIKKVSDYLESYFKIQVNEMY